MWEQKTRALQNEKNTKNNNNSVVSFCVADVTVSELLQMLKKTANTKQIYHCD